MNGTRSLCARCALIATLSISAAVLADDPTHDAFTYQGQLHHAGEPVTDAVDLKFRLFDAEVAGNQIGDELVAAGYDGFDDDGRFTIDLAFGKGVFDGKALWLEIEVDETILTPRQPIMPTPYSVRALNVATVADGALAGTYTNPLTLNNAGNEFTGAFAGSGAGLTGLNASNISTGTLGGSLLGGSYTNALTFNNAGNQFIGAFAGSGAGLTSLNASNVSAGTLNIARMPTGGNWSLSSTLNLASNTLVVNPMTNRVGIGISTPNYPLHVTSNDSKTIDATNTALGGTAVYGLAFASSGTNYGVYGLSTSTNGLGVYGSTTATSGTNTGVLGQSTSTAGRGVYGWAVNGSGETIGVFGRTDSSAGRGVFGFAIASSGTTYGVRGHVNSPSGYAGYFEGGRNYFEGNVGIGTLNPAHLLHIHGSSPSLLLENSANTPVFLRFKRAVDGPNDHYIAIGSSGHMFTRVGGSDRMTIRADTGNVGIGTSSPNFLLHVNGDAGKPGGGSWSNASDARLKQNVHPLHHSLDRLLTLEGVSYEYIDPDAIHELPGERIGMIAQNVAEVFPDWVNEADDGYLRLTYRGFEAVVVEAMRELRNEKDAELEALREEKDAEIAELSRQLDDQQRLLVDLMKRLDHLERSQR